MLSQHKPNTLFLKHNLKQESTFFGIVSENFEICSKNCPFLTDEKLQCFPRFFNIEANGQGSFVADIVRLGNMREKRHELGQISLIRRN